ncbi:MAG: hypothetical protein JW760_02055 [Spirochaetales bacterium]|nr:hypothetical protein [Spirochaetales bacterium]
MNSVILGLVPLVVSISFFIHWACIRHLSSSAERLPYCRPAYMAFSVQLLLYGWVLFFAGGVGKGGHPAVLLAAAAMTFSSAGDFFNLQFPRVTKKLGETLFHGILCFAAAQGCYILALFSLVSPGELISEGFFLPLLAALVIVPALLFRLRVYNPSRPKNIMYGAFFYGFILGAMAAVAVSAFLARGILYAPAAAGALFFLLSDAVMGETTVHGRHPVHEFQIPWITYLIAQGLLLFGITLAAG